MVPERSRGVEGTPRLRSVTTPKEEKIMTDILVLGEHADGKVKKTTFELVSKASQLAGESGGKVFCLFIGNKVGDLPGQVACFGAKAAIVVEDEKLANYNTIAFKEILVQVINQFKPSIVLGTASPTGKDVFPRLAVSVKAGLATDAIELRLDNGKLVAKRPVFSGKTLVEVSYKTPVQLATCRPNSFPTNEASTGAAPEIIKLSPQISELRCVMKEKVQGVVGKQDLTEAEIIVSGGRAMANADNFKILNAMADVIGATVGASRAAVDSGYAPHDMQVGQTGKVVNPKLYMACGISGAIQHLAGMRTSKVIVAINKDPEAPIFSKADYGIVGDLFTVIPLLTDELKKVVAES